MIKIPYKQIQEEICKRFDLIFLCTRSDTFQNLWMNYRYRKSIVEHARMFVKEIFHNCPDLIEGKTLLFDSDNAEIREQFIDWCIDKNME
jgi:hypothetical protein